MMQGEFCTSALLPCFGRTEAAISSNPAVRQITAGLCGGCVAAGVSLNWRNRTHCVKSSWERRKKWVETKAVKCELRWPKVMLVSTFLSFLFFKQQVFSFFWIPPTAKVVSKNSKNRLEWMERWAFLPQHWMWSERSLMPHLKINPVGETLTRLGRRDVYSCVCSWHVISWWRPFGQVVLN